MPTEQRVIASKPKIGAKQPSATPAPAEPEAPAKGGGKKKLFLVLGVVLVLGGAAAWYFLMGPGAAAADPAAEDPAAVEEHAEETEELGPVLVVEAVSLNLAGGHYLRLGFALQLTVEAGEHEPDSARALDVAIDLFSGRSVEEVASSEGRAALKAEFLHLLEESYHGEVMDVYFTDYVTQ